MVERHPDDAGIWAVRALFLWQSDRWSLDRSVSLCTVSIDRRPRSPTRWLNPVLWGSVERDDGNRWNISFAVQTYLAISAESGWGWKKDFDELTSSALRKSLVKIVMACGFDWWHCRQWSSNWVGSASDGIPSKQSRYGRNWCSVTLPRYCPTPCSSIALNIGPAFLPSAVRFSSIHRRSPAISKAKWYLVTRLVLASFSYFAIPLHGLEWLAVLPLRVLRHHGQDDQKIYAAILGDHQTLRDRTVTESIVISADNPLGCAELDRRRIEYDDVEDHRCHWNSRRQRHSNLKNRIRSFSRWRSSSLDRTEEECIDRQISSAGIQLPILCELDQCMSAICDQINPQRGDFEVVRIIDARSDRAVFLSVGIDHSYLRFGEHLFHLVRRCRRRKVNIVWANTHEDISHSTTSNPNLMLVALE